MNSMAGSGYRDYFKVLGVERSADADTVKRAFRKLARQYHLILIKLTQLKVIQMHH